MGDLYETTALGAVVTNLDSRRVPVSLMERLKRRGPYPYYGATGVMDHVDGYLFEGLHLLIAEDGSVEQPDGRPVVQLVDGKFWVNNHAHVLRGATDDDTRFLYYALQSIKIRPFMSGSVQAKLSQGNLNRIPIAYPDAGTRAAVGGALGLLDAKIASGWALIRTMRRLGEALVSTGPMVPIHDLASAPRSTIAPATLADESVAHFSIPAFDAGETPERTSPGALLSNKLVLDAGDVFISKLNPSIPRIGIAHDLFGLRMLGSTEWIVLRAGEGISPFSLRAALGGSFVDQVAAMASGTTGSHQRVRPEGVLALEVPDPRACDEGAKDTLAFMGQVERDMLSEVVQLDETRERLLAGLVRGELRLEPDAA